MVKYCLFWVQVMAGVDVNVSASRSVGDKVEGGFVCVCVCIYVRVIIITLAAKDGDITAPRYCVAQAWSPLCRSGNVPVLTLSARKFNADLMNL